MGPYEYDRGSCHVLGRLDGRVEGNLWHFNWTEDHRRCGRMGAPSGHGYFIFWKDSADNGRLSGEWGFGDDEGGNGRWQGFRMPNSHPHVRRGDSAGGESNSDTGNSSNSGSGSSSRPSGTGTSAPPPSSGDPLQGL